MSTTVERAPWAGQFPIDFVVPYTCVYEGIESRGEVVRASRWSTEIATPPRDGPHFKIILLQERPKNGLPKTVGQKTAFCIPALGSSREVHRISGDIKAAKHAEYPTRRVVNAAAINSALREWQQDLKSQLIYEESARFSKEDIRAIYEPGPYPEEIFASVDPARWLENLAQWLLAQSYPNPPLDTYCVPHLIGEEDAGKLFGSVFSHADADPGLLARLGSALGLSTLESPGSYDPSDCRAFSLIRGKLADRPVPFTKLHRPLAYDVGLTSPLASLLLLLFIQHECPEYQIQLKGDAVMSMVDGSQLLGTRLTPDLIFLLAWDGQLASKAESIGPATTPRSIDARHHLSILCPQIDSGGATRAEATLARSIQSIGRDLIKAYRILDALETRAKSGPDSTTEIGKVRVGVERLSRITGESYADVYCSVGDVYPALPQLKGDLEMKGDLETLAQLVSLEIDPKEIFEAQKYINDSQGPTARFPNLAVDRDVLLTGLLPSRLTRSRGRGWHAVSRNAEGFKIRYNQAYREHHRHFHDALPEYQSGLRSAKKILAALGLLNTICELRPPSGAGLEKNLDALPLPCSFRGTEIDMSHQPCCPECHISLEDTVPSAELARLPPQIDIALGEKTEKLSRLLVEKALAGKTDARWREFLQIVQASELPSLANTLDHDLISLIKKVLD